MHVYIYMAASTAIDGLYITLYTPSMVLILLQVLQQATNMLLILGVQSYMHAILRWMCHAASHDKRI